MPDETTWLNSAPLTSSSLRGKIVLVDFWTYTCINSLRNLPYIKAWATKYADAGLVVIGVHTPEFSFEHERGNVEAAARALNVTYPIAVDSDYRIWHAFNNEYWPADYFIDGKGRIRHHHFGEGDYAGAERVIQQLLQENGATIVPSGLVRNTAQGVEAVPDFQNEASDETYLGYRRATGFAPRQQFAADSRTSYRAPSALTFGEWGLEGSWTVGPEWAELASRHGRIVLRFRSRDVHLVLARSAGTDPVRFEVRLDGALLGEHHGQDTTSDGNGVVRGARLYQLVRQRGPIAERTFEIEFSAAGVRAFVFTFG